MPFKRIALIAFCIFLLTIPADADDLESLARDFWKWRAVHQPLSGDDIPRLDRAPGWLPDWSAAAVAEQRRALSAFEARWKKLDAARWPVATQVDYRLVGSAIARVRWELDVTAGWQRNPLFYYHQTVGAIFDRLLEPPPFREERAEEIVRRLENIPRTIEQAKTNLTDSRAPFARLAIGELKDVRARMQTVVRELKPFLPASHATRLDAPTEKAIAALESYRAWLEQKLPAMKQETAVGRANYVFFLKNVALLPFTPERLVEMGRQEWERAVAFESYEHNRNRRVPELKVPRYAADQMWQMEKDDAAARRFLEERGIQTVPAWVRRYVLRPVPAYLAPLSGMGVNNDLTGPTRLDRDGTSWIPQPDPSLGYFYKAYASDPRTQIAHEGQGHYLQLVLSWAHENWLRRHYYDSGPNEGLAFYNEEMLLQAGFFEDSPRTREVIYSFMRLRALRVEVDVKLATGEFTIERAAEYLRTVVPMDAKTALEEAAFFASAPGQAITYQIGKLQIVRMLADARLKQGEKFTVRAFHDFVWKNGNVPLALQRWELLGLRDEVDAVDALR